MNELTYSEYWTEIASIADTLISESMDENEQNRETAEEDINDSRLHETIDGHQWVIYNAYNLDVIKRSENEDYFNDNFGAEALGESLKEGGLATLHCHIAYWCMYADVQNKLENCFDQYMDNKS